MGQQKNHELFASMAAEISGAGTAKHALGIPSL
jgi:hypothetical protein